MGEDTRRGQAEQTQSPGPPEGTEVLDKHVCWELLKSGTIGRLAVIVDGEPDILPVNYVVDHGSIVFRTDTGRKLSAAANRPVAFEVDAYDDTTETAWSVVVHGVGAEIRDLDEVIEAMSLPLHPWQEGRKARYMRISAREVSGRRIHVRGATT